MKKNRKTDTGTIIAVIIIILALGALAYYFLLPKGMDIATKHKEEGMDLLKKYEQNHDMIGWIQVEGTNISYPVMKGDRYLYKDFNGESSNSGTPFVENNWKEDDICTLIYSHNMYMYGTMFHQIHEFEDRLFFNKNTKIKFYAICGNDEKYVEKRTFLVSHCILTQVDEWNFSGCQYIQNNEDLSEYLTECEDRALHKRAWIAANPEKIITLSTCSYHVKGHNGRILLVGKLKNVRNQRYLDKM